MCSVWQEIHGFESPGEYARFERYIAEQVARGHAEELDADPEYGRGEVFGGKWFKDTDTGEVWRLVPPDFPFKGIWEPVET